MVSFRSSLQASRCKNSSSKVMYYQEAFFTVCGFSRSTSIPLRRFLLCLGFQFSLTRSILDIFREFFNRGIANKVLQNRWLISTKFCSLVVLGQPITDNLSLQDSVSFPGVAISLSHIIISC